MSDPALAPLHFTRKGRTWATLLAVAGTWVLLLLAWLILGAAIWILGFFALFTLPALRDLWLGTEAGSDLNDTELSWYSGGHEIRLPLRDIDHVRLVTRLDMSVRVAPVLFSGRKLRMPIESTPPHQELEAALKARGVRTQRHHFVPL